MSAGPRAPAPDAAPTFAAGPGEMAARVRAFDWSDTPLGPAETWPQALKVAVGICLNSRFPMFVWWGPELINIYNDAYAPVLGKRHPDALGRPARQSWREIWPVVRPQAEAVMTRGEATWNERVLLVMERNGYAENTWFTWSYSPIPDETGRIGGLFCACTEETPRVLVEGQRDRLLAELDTERSRLAEVFNRSPSFMAVVRGPDHVFELVNDRYYQLVGRRDLVGLSVREALPEVEGQGFFEQLDRVYSGGEPLVGKDVRILLRRDPALPPEERYVDFVYQPMRDGDGAVTGIFAHGVDLTERKRAEEALRASDQQMRLLTDALPALIAYVDAGQRYRFNNRAYQDWFGGAPAALAGLHLRDVLGEDEYLRRRPYVEAALRGEPARFEVLTRHRSRGAVETEVLYVPDRAADGRVNGFVVLVQDVSERKASEIALRASEERLQLAVQIAQMGTFEINLLTDAVRVNDAGRLIYGWPDAEPLTFARVRTHFHPDDREWVLRAVGAACAPEGPGEFEVEQRIVRTDGAVRWVRVRGRALFATVGGDRRAVRCVGTYLDITDQKEAETQREHLLAAERAARAEAERASEAKSQFLATLSHELRTPLTPVLLTVSLMEMHPDLPEELREDVATIRRNVELESRLIADLLDLTRVASGKLALEVQDVDLHAAVRGAEDICQREASVRIVLDLNAVRHRVRGDATRLQQVFWNLVSNAAKFTGPDGLVTVRSYDAPGGRVRVDVADTGLGIDPSVLPKLFNAFEQGDVRLGRQQAGLGLGLAITRRLAEAHGGTVTAASAGRGHGATFTVDLPAAEAPAASAAPEPSADAPAAGPPMHVLVVEDHEPTLKVMSKLLRGLGHRVTGATSVATAAAAARQNGFDLIISDLGLPDGSGLDVMREVREEYTGRAIALTGYGMESDIAASREAGFAEHLTKPVDLAALEAAIRRLAGP